MNYQDYDDYMRSLLEYSNMNCPNTCMNIPTSCQNMMCQSDDDLERMYPDTYRIIYPMVFSTCNMVNINTTITTSMVDRMTDDIYDRAALDNRINIDINMDVETIRDDNFRQPRRNRFLRDFIRVLLLRELLRRRRRIPIRPF